MTPLMISDDLPADNKSGITSTYVSMSDPARCPVERLWRNGDLQLLENQVCLVDP